LFFYKVQAIGTNGLQSERSAFIGGQAQADEAAPGTPRNVSAVADENDPGQITVGWSAPSVDADGGGLTGLSGFVLLRAEGSDGALLTVDTLDADVRTFVDIGLKALTTYRYAMVAFDASGNQSTQVQSSSTQTAGIPTPASVQATDGLGRITLTWQAVDSDDLQGYEVHRATNSDGTYDVIAGSEGSSFTTGRTSFVDSNLAGGTLLFYKVRAIGANGITSELSTFVSGEAAADESAPGAPQNVSVIPSETDPTQITVRWTAPIVDADGAARTGLAGFRLLRAEASGSLVPVATIEADVRQFDDSALRSLTVYRYALIAFDADGNESAQSSSGQAQTIGVSVPAGLLASDKIGRIEISWTAVEDDDLIGYNVFRSSRPDLDYTQLPGDGADAFTTGRTSFVDSTATSGDLFYYEVTAVTADLQSERSAFVSGRAATDDVAPVSPSDLVAIADDTQALVTLSWIGSKSDQDGGDLTGLSSYIVFRGKDSSSALAALDTIDSGFTSYSDNALSAATTYFYAVSAIDGSGNVSPRSTSVLTTTQGIGSPQNVDAAGDVKSITVSWTASDEDDLQGYNVYRSDRSDEGYSRLTGTEGASFTTGQTSYIDSNLAGGQILFYRISVVTVSGESDQSAFDGATVQTDTRSPAAPTFLDGDPVTDDPERLSLSWRPPGSDSDGLILTGVSLYRVYRSTTADGDYQQIATSDSTSYSDSGLEQRTTYFYQVEALDSDGNISPRSSTAAVTTSGVDLPTNVGFSASTPSDLTEPPVVTISWTKSAGAIVRYEVERAVVANSTTDSDYTAVTPNNVNTTRDDDGVARGTTYYYRVRAIDGDGRQSDWTEPRSVTVKN
jgi:fibronectin type 3 domain-containing protein